MDLYQEIIERAVQDAIVKSKRSFLEKLILEMRCCKALEKIKVILADDTLDDAECFERIEKIVCVFDELGSNGGGRHDF